MAPVCSSPHILLLCNATPEHQSLTHYNVQCLLMYFAIEKKKLHFVITQAYFQLNDLLKIGKQLQSIDLKHEKDLTTQWFQIRNGAFGNDVNLLSQ